MTQKRVKNRLKNKQGSIILYGLMVLLGLFLINSASALTHITNCTELQAMNESLSEDYVLDNNIDCSDTINWNSGEGFVPVGNFIGTFNGQGYNITNLFQNRTSLNTGVFSSIQYGEIKNVGLINFMIFQTDNNAGLLAGNMDNNENVSNVFATGNLESSGGEIGGLIGVVYDGIIENSWTNVNIKCTGTLWDCGGLVGYSYAKIINSSAKGNINSTIEYTGGLVGQSDAYYGGYIENSYATGNVSGINYSGGLSGYNYADTNITNSYATGNVTGNIYVGGLIGWNSGTISNSYATGNVSGSSNVGGLIGYNLGTILNSYWDINTSGINISYGGEGKTTTEMKLFDTFVDWDFENIWGLNESYSYPCLRWQGCILTLLPEIISPQETSGQIIYNLLVTSGAGLGILFQIMGAVLPILIIGLCFVSIIVAIGYGIKRVIDWFR